MGNLLRLVGAYMKTNIATALEYRASMLSQVLGMFVNDILWVSFWVLYFTKFPVLKGWALEDVIVLWSTLPLSYGLVTGLLANCVRIPQMVVQGQLDYYLALPKDVLLHMLISDIRPIALGDALFGLILVLTMVKLTVAKLLVFLLVSLVAAVMWLALYVLTGSLVFYIGNAETVASQFMNMVLHFATYPTPIFDNTVKILLFTLLPAGFLSTLPVELVREFHLAGFLELLGAALLLLAAAVFVFRRGLRRYESGNLMVMRS